MTRQYELSTLTVQGTVQEMGRAQGEEFKTLIRDFIPMRFEAFSEYAVDAGLENGDALLPMGKICYEIFRHWDVEAFEEHHAIAEAAGVDPVALYTAANMTDIRDAVVLAASDADEGCSSLLIPPSHSASKEILAGQTWDLNPQDIDYVVGIHRIPNDGLETWSVTLSGCPSLVGMNQNGRMVGTTNIKTWGSKPGICYMNILHRALTASSWEEAAAVVANTSKAGAHTYWMADREHAMEWEASPETVVLRDTDKGPVCRTNHCIAEPIRKKEWQEPSSSTTARLARIKKLLATGEQSLESVKALFADRSDGVDSVNRYPEDEQGTATNSVVIGIPEKQELWACRGPADRGIWQKLTFQRPMPE